MIYQPRIEQSDWSEVTSHGTSLYIAELSTMVLNLAVATEPVAHRFVRGTLTHPH